MKEVLLSYISEARKAAVEPIIDNVLEMYNGNVELLEIQGSISRFHRTFTETTEVKIPIGKIELALDRSPEEAMVHELLHLTIPEYHDIYAFGFDNKVDDFANFHNQVQNSIEHEFFFAEYLQLGYQIDKFMAPPPPNPDFEKQLANGNISPLELLFRYFNSTICIGLVPTNQKLMCRRSIDQILKFAEKRFPGLNSVFPKLKNWIDQKNYTQEYFNEIRKLYEIFQVPVPTNYLKLEENGLLYDFFN